MDYYAYETTGNATRFVKAFHNEIDGLAWIAKQALKWQRLFNGKLYSFKLCYNGFKSYHLHSVDSAMQSANLEALSKSI
jgi:hypothetical protein